MKVPSDIELQLMKAVGQNVEPPPADSRVEKLLEELNDNLEELSSNSIYDEDKDGIVDKAEGLTGSVDISQVTGLEEALNEKADNSIYDEDKDGIVDKAESLTGSVDISQVTGLEEALNAKAEDSKLVETNNDLSSHTSNKENPHDVTAAQVGAAVLAINATVSVNTSNWTLQSNKVLYRKGVTVSGILSTDKPIVDLGQSGTEVGKDDVMREFWSKVTRITSYDGGIYIYATEVPTILFNINIMVVR